MRIYQLKDKLEYFYFSNTLNKVKFINVAPGQIIFTPNLEVHATFFPEKSKLVVVSGFLRDTKSYESDTVRVEFVNFENFNEAKANKLKWKPKVKIEDGIRVMLKNINYWKKAPVWNSKTIQTATKDWFKYLK